MAKSYTTMCKTANAKYAIISYCKNNKFLIILSLFCCLIGLLTGIFVAVKCKISLSTLGDFNLNIYTCQNYANFGAFCNRVFSYFCVMLILTITSLYVLLVPIGFITCAYRSYLIGFNCTLLVCLFGFSGAITSILVILPCQIVAMLVLVAYFMLAVCRAVEKKKVGSSCLSLSKIFIVCFLILIAVAIIESLLLLLFNANTILVI